MRVVLYFIGIMVCSITLHAQIANLKYKTSATIDSFDYENEMREIAGTARIVGMGEAAHGGTEFELIKAELVKTLVTRYGYRHLLLEAGVPQCAAINEYISSGKGDPKRIMGLYFSWPYKTLAFYNIVNWLKDFNSGKPINEQVKFYGMDVQASQPLKAMRFELTKYGNITGLTDTLLLPDLEAVNGTEKENKELLEKIYARYAGRNYENRTDSLVIMNIIETQICNNIQHGGSRYAYREEILFKYAVMVINALPKEEKIMIWAHNSHVSKNCSKRKSMGSMLLDEYGNDYKSIGFEFSRGSFRATSMDENTKKYTLGVYNTEGCKGALGNTLQNLNKGVLGINAAANNKNVLIDNKQLINSIGAEFNYNSAKDDKFYTEKLVVSKSFDYLFVVNVIHPNVSMSGSQ